MMWVLAAGLSIGLGHLREGRKGTGKSQRDQLRCRGWKGQCPELGQRLLRLLSSLCLDDRHTQSLGQERGKIAP